MKALTYPAVLHSPVTLSVRAMLGGGVATPASETTPASAAQQPLCPSTTLLPKPRTVSGSPRRSFASSGRQASGSWAATAARARRERSQNAPSKRCTFHGLRHANGAVALPPLQIGNGSPLSSVRRSGQLHGSRDTDRSARGGACAASSSGRSSSRAPRAMSEACAPARLRARASPASEVTLLRALRRHSAGRGAADDNCDATALSLVTP
jgi:hypothetical protein